MAARPAAKKAKTTQTITHYFSRLATAANSTAVKHREKSSSDKLGSGDHVKQQKQHADQKKQRVEQHRQQKEGKVARSTPMQRERRRLQRLRQLAQWRRVTCADARDRRHGHIVTRGDADAHKDEGMDLHVRRVMFDEHVKVYIYDAFADDDES